MSQPTITPYLCVADTRAALDWYSQVLGAVAGEPIVMDDGRVGHAEMRIDGAPVFVSDPFDEAGVAPIDQATLAPVTVHLRVADCAATLERARQAGARVDRGPDPTPVGLIAVVRDPFGHRWMFNQPVSEEE